MVEEEPAQNVSLRHILAETKAYVTSGIMKLPAIASAPSRLSTASFRTSDSGICAPVRMTGLPRFSSRKESALAYLTVSCEQLLR